MHIIYKYNNTIDEILYEIEILTRNLIILLMENDINQTHFMPYKMLYKQVYSIK